MYINYYIKTRHKGCSESRSEWQEKARTTEEDLEEAGGRADRESWFEEGGCPETRQVEGWSASNCRRNGVNPAISAKGKTSDKN